MFSWLLLPLLAGSLFVLTPSRADGDELLTMGSLALIAALGLITPKRRTVWSFGPTLILIWAIITTAVRFRYPVYASTLNLFVGVFALKSLSERISLTKASFRGIGICLTLWAVASIVMCILQHMKIDYWYAPLFGGELAGFSFRPWILGCTAAMAVPFLLTVHPACALLAVPLLYFSHSSACVLAALVSVWIMLRPTYRAPFSILALILMSIYFFKLDGGVDPHRLAVWKNSWKYFTSPILGFGLGSWAHDGYIHQNGTDLYHWRWAHNELYQYFYEQGAIGVSLVLLWLTALYIRVRQHPLMLALLTSLLTLSMFHPILHWGKLSFLATVIFAMAMATNTKGETFYE